MNKKEKLTKLNKSKRGKTIKQTQLKYLNPKTNNIIGYFRALNLHLTTNEDVKKGLINKKTGRLVGIKRALQMNLAEPHMLKPA